MATIYDFLAGSSTAFSKIIIGYPFDTIKTKFQTKFQKKFKITYRDEIRYIINKNGFLSLYRGCTMLLQVSIIKRGFQLSIFEKLNKTHSSVFAGMTAGCISSVISNPFNIVKIHMQSKNKASYKNSMDCIDKIYKKNGLRGFSKGLKINVIHSGLFSGSFLGIYGYLRDKVPNYPLYHSLSSILASVATWTMLIPIDTYKTILQSPYKNNILLNEIKKNPLLLWRGLTPMIIRTVPINAINMLVYEKIRKKLL